MNALLIEYYQLIPAKYFYISYDIVLLFLLQASSLQAGIEEISMRRSFGRLAKESRQRNLAHLGISISQERKKLDTNINLVFRLTLWVLTSWKAAASDIFAQRSISHGMRLGSSGEWSANAQDYIT